MSMLLTRSRLIEIGEVVHAARASAARAQAKPLEGVQHHHAQVLDAMRPRQLGWPDVRVRRGRAGTVCEQRLRNPRACRTQLRAAHECGRGAATGSRHMRRPRSCCSSLLWRDRGSPRLDREPSWPITQPFSSMKTRQIPVGSFVCSSRKRKSNPGASRLQTTDFHESAQSMCRSALPACDR